MAASAVTSEDGSDMTAAGAAAIVQNVGVFVFIAGILGAGVSFPAVEESCSSALVISDSAGYPGGMVLPHHR